jgi:uncharacterized membrane protein (UPF0136 family)
VEDHHISKATSIVSSSLSSAVSSIASPANNYGVNAGLNSAALPGQTGVGSNETRGVRTRKDYN